MNIAYDEYDEHSAKSVFLIHFTALESNNTKCNTYVFGLFF